MAIVMYDLVGADDRRFSPNCWRTRMALLHKGLEHEARPTQFEEIKTICDGERKTIPTIEDGDKVVTDSLAIADYLEETYADRPSLFDGPVGRGLAAFVQNWTQTVVNPGVVGMVVADIHDHLVPTDQAYFRASREKLFGRPLEEVQAGREDRLDSFRKSLTPLRATVSKQAFLGGDRPTYADYLAFAPFQWARSISDFRILADDDPVAGWFGRVLDLYDGAARRSPAYY